MTRHALLARTALLVFTVASLFGVSLFASLRATTHAGNTASVAIVVTVLPGGHLDLAPLRTIELLSPAGRQVRLSISNLSAVAHVFVIPRLNLTALIAPSPHRNVAAVTKIGFQIPRAGTYRWSYVLACGSTGSPITPNDGHASGEFIASAAV